MQEPKAKCARRSTFEPPAAATARKLPPAAHVSELINAPATVTAAPGGAASPPYPAGHAATASAPVAVLGLVSSKRAELETKEDLLRRIDQAAKIVPLENLALSPQCGFASVAEGNPVTEEVEWAKIRLVADVARQVWG